jgi:predicted Zn-dependent protease
MTSPINLDDRLALATALAAAGDSDGAAREVASLERAAPQRAEVSFVRAFVALRREQLEEAVGAARRALVMRPQYPEARLVLAEGLLRGGHDGEGRQELKRFLAEAPQRLVQERGLAEQFLREGHTP